MLKKILTISSIVLVVAGLLTLTSYSYHLQSTQNINEVIVHIDNNNHVGFILPEEINHMINPKDTLLTYRMCDLDTKVIETALSNNPFIEKADCYGGLDGGLYVNIKEKNPVVRVYEKSTSYYIDEKGAFFPINKNHAPRVIIANGHFREMRKKDHQNIYDSVYTATPLPDLYHLVSEIRSNDLLSAQISQIYYTSRGEWELVPELGGHIIKLGSLNNLEEKLDNLIAFYHDLSHRDDWDNYQIINLTFNNQIVCTKK